jgi:hypothetical protein
MHMQGSLHVKILVLSLSLIYQLSCCYKGYMYIYANNSHQQSPLRDVGLLEYVNCPKQGPRIHSIRPNPLPDKAMSFKRLSPII